jgi:transposase-like protein
MAMETYSKLAACKGERLQDSVCVTRSVWHIAVSDIRRTDVSCPKCKARMDEVARIAPLKKSAGLVAYECPGCRYTMSEILPARGDSAEDQSHDR